MSLKKGLSTANSTKMKIAMEMRLSEKINIAIEDLDCIRLSGWMRIGTDHKTLTVHTTLMLLGFVPQPNLLGNYLNLGTVGGFFDLDSGLKRLAELGHVGNCQNAGKISSDRLDSGN
jgi:hypothetical protein